MVNINKMKPYKSMEDQIVQNVIIKPNDFLSKKLIETKHFGNMSIEESVETNHYGNLFNEERVETNHYSN